MSLMGIDVGTTGCKIVALSVEGRTVAEARREYPLSNPAQGVWELDAERVWQDVSSCIATVAAKTHADPVTALSISALGEAVVPVGRDGRPLCRAPVSADYRAERQARLLVERLGGRTIHAITGQPATAQYSLTKMMWWQENEPEIYARTWKFLCFGDYILTRLGLEPVIDYSMASRTLAFDIHRLAWSDTMLTAAGISTAKLPRTAASDAVVGRLPDLVAASLGLPQGIKVIAGGFDQVCGAFGVGVTAEGNGFYGLGTTEALAVVLAPPFQDLFSVNMALCPHVVPGKMIAMAGSQTGGRLLRWFRDEFAGEERVRAADEGRDVYDVIIEGIAQDPTALMILPHFTGSGTVYGDSHSKGAIIGLTFDTKRSDVAKAILEGVTYEQAACLSRLDEIGIRINELMVVGGGARSDTWLQIKADIMGRPLHRSCVADASCLGAAILAGCGSGVFADTDGAIGLLAGQRQTFVPDRERNAVYRRRLKIYEQLYRSLAEVYTAWRSAEEMGRSASAP